jgi:hypothetical protein
MQLRHDALDAHLAKSLAPLYVIASDEHLLAQEASNGANCLPPINPNRCSAIKN